MLLIPKSGEFAGNEGIGLVNVIRRGKYVWKILPRFRRILEVTPYAISVMFDDYKCAFINYKGEVLSDLFFFIDTFSEGLWPVQVKSDKWGFVNTKMEFVIPPQFATASRFKNGISIVSIKEKGLKYGVINKKGEWLLPPIYDFVDYANDGFYRVCRDRKWGFVSQTHEIFGDFEDCGFFSEGFAAVKKNEKWGFVDTNGKLVIPYLFDNLRRPYFNEGLAAVSVNEKYGFIDQNGNFVIQPEFDDATLFSEGFAAVKRNMKWGFIDKTGKLVHPFQWDDTLVFSEGLCAVKKNWWGYIDTNGKIIIECRFDEAYLFTEGLAAVALFKRPGRDGSNKFCFGYINHNGDWVIPPVFEHATPFYQNHARVLIEGAIYTLEQDNGKIFLLLNKKIDSQKLELL